MDSGAGFQMDLTDVQNGVVGTGFVTGDELFNGSNDIIGLNTVHAQKGRITGIVTKWNQIVREVGCSRKPTVAGVAENVNEKDLAMSFPQGNGGCASIGGADSGHLAR